METFIEVCFFITLACFAVTVYFGVGTVALTIAYKWNPTVVDRPFLPHEKLLAWMGVAWDW